MAKCKGCGAEVLDESVFCPYCGEKNEVVEESKQEYVYTESPEEVIKEPVVEPEKKVWKVFAQLGFTLGLIGLILNGLSFLLAFSADLAISAISLVSLGTELALPGLVFSILGKRSPSLSGKAKKGMVLSIVGLSLLIVVIFVAIFSIAASGANMDDLFGYYEYFVK